MSPSSPPDDETVRIAAPAGDLGEVALTLERSLRVLMSSASHPRVAYDAVRQAWLPALLQALAGYGGDGLDAWLAGLLELAGRLPAQRLFGELVAALLRMRAARDVAHLEEEALKAIELVRRTGRAGPPRPLSLQVLERALEGALTVEQLLLVASGSDDDLRRRLGEIDAGLKQLKAQLLRHRGQKPAGLEAGFGRLKAELRVLDAELRRRAGPPGDETPVG